MQLQRAFLVDLCEPCVVVGSRKSTERVVLRADVILANYSELIHFENEKELFVNIKHEKLFIKDFFVINETLYIYEKDQLNKFLILSY